jgi:pimeloyl-ACP methyl ester carboxylesterase
LAPRAARGDHRVPLTVIGWSFGAAIVLSCSSPLIERRVLVSPGGLVRLSTPPSLLVAATRWALRRRPADSAALLRAMHGPGFSPRVELVAWMTLLARYVRSSADPGRAAPTDTGAAIPTTVAISGDADVFLPPRRLAPAVRKTLGIELITVAGGGHLLAEESPHEIAALSHR